MNRSAHRAAPLLVAVAALLGCTAGRSASVIAHGPPSSARPGKSASNGAASGAAPTTNVVPTEDTEVHAVPSPDGSSVSATDAGGGAAATTQPSAGQRGGSGGAVSGPSIAPSVAQSVSPTAPAGDGPPQAKRSFERFGYALTDAEASCVAGSIDPGVLASLDRTDLDVPTDKQLVAAVTALATCEPTSYMNYQVQALVGSYGITTDQGRCVTKAADHLAVSDANIAAVMLDDWTVLGSPSRDHLLAAVMSCVDQVTAKTIVTT